MREFWRLEVEWGELGENRISDFVAGRIATSRHTKLSEVQRNWEIDLGICWSLLALWGAGDQRRPADNLRNN